MKKVKKNRGVVKGAPSGFVISLMIHAAAFMLAGMLVVFNVVKKEEKKFVPPKPVERPKMKLKKPKVKVKKTARPKSSQRIVTKVKRASMPDIQLPEMSGIGDGLVGGVGGFDLVPELESINVMGSTKSIGCDLVGTFYDFNRKRNGNINPTDTDVYISELIKFVESGWKSSKLAKYYRSPKKLYATTIAVPPMNSPMAPSAFDEPDNEDRCWVVHYKGQLVQRDGITFRFVGNSDDVMVVRVDGKVVLDSSRSSSELSSKWNSSSADDRKWYMAHDYCGVGDVVELEPGIPKDLEIIIGERPGGIFNAILCVMEEGVEYEKSRTGTPILPLFKTAPLTRRLQDLIVRGMPPDEVNVTAGPIFNDFSGSSSSVSPEERPAPKELMASVEPEPEVEPSDLVRLWTSKDGKTFEGEFVTVIGKEVVLKTARGKQKKIPVELFSDDDLNYISLSSPPEFKLDLGKTIRQRRLKFDVNGLIGINAYTFTPKIKSSSVKYTHPLTIDYWVLGGEIGGNKYMLLDKGSSTFIPSEMPKGEYSFSGRSVDLYDWVLGHTYQQRRGERYEGYLITVTDERGEVVAQRSSPSWLYKNIENLRQLELDSFMDETCTQQWPTPIAKAGIN